MRSSGSAVSRRRRADAAARVLLGVLVVAAVGVGIGAVVNPNGIRFGAPWPVAAEVLAAIAGLVLASGISARRRSMANALFLTGALLAVTALLLLAGVAFTLSFNQA